MHNPPHSGDVLREWLTGVSVTEAAKSLGVTRAALSRVLNGSAGISADMDLRLSKALGTTPGTWYTMQANYDMWRA
jgi:addiction module HigA family antidote